jgi:polar amino acid transport system substrate-binding protein
LGKKVIVTKGTTSENYFTSKQPDVDLLKFDSKTQQFNAMKNGRATAVADDNSYIAPAVKKGNKHINKLNNDGFFVNDYNQELKPCFDDVVKPSDIIMNK